MCSSDFYYGIFEFVIYHVKVNFKNLTCFPYLSVFLSFLDCMFIQFMQFSCIKFSEFRNKYPKVSLTGEKENIPDRLALAITKSKIYKQIANTSWCALTLSKFENFCKSKQYILSPLFDLFRVGVLFYTVCDVVSDFDQALASVLQLFTL